MSEKRTGGQSPQPNGGQGRRIQRRQLDREATGTLAETGVVEVDTVAVRHDAAYLPLVGHQFQLDRVGRMVAIQHPALDHAIRLAVDVPA